MNAHSIKIEDLEKTLRSNVRTGINSSDADRARSVGGANVLRRKKKKSLFKRLIEALSEPTLVILEFAWVVTLGVNVGKAARGDSPDAYECVGIFVAIMISAVLTVFMEGRSQRAFDLLRDEYSKTSVKGIRDGKVVPLSKEEVVVGDVICLEAGDKIVADGRIVEGVDLRTDESALTGESERVEKMVGVLPEDTPLAERSNCVYSGTFVSSGTGRMLTTAVGEKTEFGKIAAELGDQAVVAPLNERLASLGKKVTIIGAISSAAAFVLSLIRLSALQNLSFLTVQEAFIEAIVLIVAAVPEGLPTTAAISLSLNVLKLAKSNALIRKLVAAETAGRVSVICSDKTGTLTENEMTVERIFGERGRSSERSIAVNSSVNSTATVKRDKGKFVVFGSATEGALLKYCLSKRIDYEKLRDKRLIGEVLPFDSDRKFMASEYFGTEGRVIYLKGAPERVLSFSVGEKEKTALLSEMAVFQRKGRRVVAFAKKVSSGKGIERELGEKGFEFDGYAVISDPVRKDVALSARRCLAAGIDVKILTGDNIETASAVAAEIGILKNPSEAISGDEIEKMTDARLREIIRSVKVVARSSPSVKLRVVEALKSLGETVAATGDGVNDAPAIKRADIGIAMGSGSEITKEASDIVLLDDSFATITKAVAFGRNIYSNFRRFITFQLTVNAAAMIVVIASLALGLESPFNALQLLWIDVIMDGPPALTLALEKGDKSVMKRPPIRRDEEIVSRSDFLRIVLTGGYMAVIIVAEYLYDFLGAGIDLVPTAIFASFVIFQLFNAFNCRKLSTESAFSSLGQNKPLVFAFFATFVFQIFISQTLGGFFGTKKMPVELWIKIIATCFSVVLVSEIAKFFIRVVKKGQKDARRTKIV